MRTGKLLGRLSFVVGFIGPILFYAVPPPFATYQQFAVCPFCPHVEVLFSYPLLRLQIGLQFGLIQGLVFAVLGFATGYFISAIGRS